MPLYLWSQTAATNASADSTINWAEGQAPSSVNDSARGMMAAVAKYRDDIAGSIVTGGTSTAYTVTTNSGFDTLAHLAGQVVAFTPHTTNGATVTLNVDSLGAKPLRTAPSVELQSNTLIQGTPYAAIYNSSDGAFYLFGVGGAPGIPLGSGVDFWGSTTPSSAFAFPTGQAISRTTYASLFAIMGTTYGAGDGSTTFNLPDKTGRISAMKEAAATRLTSAYFGGNSANMGAVGGLESNSVILTHNHSITDPGHAHDMQFRVGNTTTAGAIPYGGSSDHQTIDAGATQNNITGISINNAGSASAHNICQPTIICNYIIRII